MKYLIVLTLLVISFSTNGQFLYGTTSSGGTNGTGTIFRTNLDGTQLTTEYNFGPSESPGIGPSRAQLLEIGGKLYGTTRIGGLFGGGVLYEYDFSTGAYVVKKDFESLGRGKLPNGQIGYVNGKIFGTTEAGGTNDAGIIYSYDLAADALTKRAEFSTAASGPTGLTLANNGKLYGLTVNNGTSHGTIFEFDPSSGSSQKFAFDGTTTGDVNNTDGLTLASNGKLYGTTRFGGLNNGGTLFEFDPSSGTHTKKFDFDNSGASTPIGPMAAASDNMLYGTAITSSTGVYFIFQYDPATSNWTKKSDFPTIYEAAPIVGAQLPSGKIYISTSEQDPGSILEYDPAIDNLTVLKTFNSDWRVLGAHPYAVTLASNGKMYGVTQSGGLGEGTLFEFDRASGPNGTLTKKIDFNKTVTGYAPWNALALGGNGKLYGSANGGTDGYGLIYEFDPVSKLFAIKVQFTDLTTMGSNPAGAMTLAGDGKLYGITPGGGTGFPPGGGSAGNGIVFQFDPLTGTFVKKLDLQSLDGRNVLAPLISGTGNKMYTTALLGGTNGAGTLLEYQWDTNVLTKLHDFDFTSGLPFGTVTPTGSGTFLGRTSNGTNSKGTIFEFNPSGNVYTTKINFDGTYGVNPVARLLHASNGKYYGMTELGGANDRGVLYEYDFSNNTPINKGNLSANTGGRSQNDLMEGSPGKLYGLTPYGGILNAGTLVEYDLATGSITKKQDFLGFNGVRPMNGSMINVDVTPVITNFSPTTGLVGQVVTITGANFSTNGPDNIVKFNGVTANFTVISSTLITALVPDGATTGAISVTVNALSASTSNNFTVLYPPIISSYTPTTGAAGASVTITGTYFNAIAANNLVKFNGTTAVVTASTTTSITTTVPVGASSGFITVTDTNTNLTGTSAGHFTVTLLPAISSFTPTSGPIGTSVTITGTNFDTTPGNVTVKFNGLLAPITSITALTIVVAVPPGASTGPISVTQGTLTSTSLNWFAVTVPPTVTSFTPTSGPAGTSVTITGTNFDALPGNIIVKFNGLFAPITSSTPTTIVATVPVGAITGPISVTVNSLTATSANSFTVVLTTGDLQIFETGKFVVYPNPAGDEIIVILDAFEEGKSIELSVFDVLGKQIEKFSTSSTASFSLDVRSYLRGSYIIRASQDSKNLTHRFVKNQGEQ